MVSEVIKLGQTNLSYQLSRKGDGPTVALIHCFGSNKKYWDFHKTSFSNYNNLIFDVPGHGESTLYKGRCSLEQIADDIVALLDRLNIDQIHLGGVSMGGMISQTLILKYPERVTSLMLINTTCEISEDQKILWKQRGEKVLSKGIQSVHKAMMERWFTKNTIKSNAPGYKYMSNAFKSFSVQSFRVISEAMCNLNTNEKLKTIEVPTLIVATPNDPGAPTYISKRMAEFIKGSTLHWLQPAQHLSSLEHPAEFNSIVHAFLSQQD